MITGRGQIDKTNLHLFVSRHIGFFFRGLLRCHDESQTSHHHDTQYNNKFIELHSGLLGTINNKNKHPNSPCTDKNTTKMGWRTHEGKISIT